MVSAFQTRNLLPKHTKVNSTFDRSDRSSNTLLSNLSLLIGVLVFPQQMFAQQCFVVSTAEKEALRQIPLCQCLYLTAPVTVSTVNTANIDSTDSVDRSFSPLLSPLPPEIAECVETGKNRTGQQANSEIKNCALERKL